MPGSGQMVLNSPGGDKPEPKRRISRRDAEAQRGEREGKGEA